MAQQKILLFWEIYNDLKQKVESSLVANEENCLHMCDECHKLTQLVSELAASLSSYELRRAQTGIIELQAKIAEIKNSSKPLKEPFKFKRVAQAVPNNLAADKSTVKNVAGINSGENPSPAFSGKLLLPLWSDFLNAGLEKMTITNTFFLRRQVLKTRRVPLISRKRRRVIKIFGLTIWKTAILSSKAVRAAFMLLVFLLVTSLERILFIPPFSSSRAKIQFLLSAVNSSAATEA